MEKQENQHRYCKKGHRFQNDLNVWVYHTSRLTASLHGDLAKMTVEGAIDFLETIELDARNRQISVPILNEIIDQLRFMAKWLDYLIINRSTITFYGVKTKRSRMANQTG